MNAQSMTVRVADWSRGREGGKVIVRSIEISAACPKCGGPRGTSEPHRFYEDGDWHVVDIWANPCGDTDLYESALAEARWRQASVATQTGAASAPAPSLEWARQLDADDLEGFLRELSDAAEGVDDLETLAAVENVVATWWAFSEAHRDHETSAGARAESRVP